MSNIVFCRDIKPVMFLQFTFIKVEPKKQKYFAILTKRTETFVGYLFFEVKKELQSKNIFACHNICCKSS